MKHSLQATIALVIMFLIAQFIGLHVINNYIDAEKTAETGETVWEPLPSIAGMQLGRPEVKQTISFLYIFGAILLGTILILLIIRFKKVTLWKIWFLIAVILCLHIAFGAFVSATIALTAAIIFGLLKVYKSSFLIHNGTELFIYGGLAAIFVPLFSILGAVILLILISLYDMYAVWKSKHMIKMAKFQARSGMFAGLLLPYAIPKKGKAKKKRVSVRTAILGGGDIGFPLIFAGVILKQMGFVPAIVVVLFTSLALFGLLTLGKQKKFYPAMPFISIGCLVGYGVAWLL